MFLKKEKEFITTAIVLLAWPQIVLADIPTGLFQEGYFYFPLVLAIESLIFVIYSNILLNLRISFIRIIIATLFANIATSLLGVPFYVNRMAWGHGLLILTICALVLSAFIEWAVYTPFFRKSNIDSVDLFRISLVGNAFTHSLVALILRFQSPYL